MRSTSSPASCAAACGRGGGAPGGGTGGAAIDDFFSELRDLDDPDFGKAAVGMMLTGRLGVDDDDSEGDGGTILETNDLEPPWLTTAGALLEDDLSIYDHEPLCTCCMVADGAHADGDEANCDSATFYFINAPNGEARVQSAESPGDLGVDDGTAVVDCGAAHRVVGSAGHWLPQRSNMASTVGQAEAVFSDWRRSQFTRAVFRALQLGTVDGRRILMDFRCKHQHQHGAISGFGCGQAARGATQLWLCTADFDHWNRNVGGVEPSLVGDQNGRFQ